jgi:hypothetical protein
MYIYLIETYILSIVAVMLYALFVRPLAALQHRKYALLSMIGLSLLLPFFIDTWAEEQGDPLCLHSHLVPETVCVDYCPNPDELPSCYEIALLQDQFCTCNIVSKENLLVFRYNYFYDTCLKIVPLFQKILFPLAAIVILWWLLQIAYLYYILLRSRRETIQIKGKTYTLLHPCSPLAVGSFRLWNGYIIWQKELDHLTSPEREAVLWHEIAHLKQYDTWLQIMLGLVQPLWVINPAYYFLNRELRLLSELIADKFAVAQINNTRLYVSVLLKMKLARQTNAIHYLAAGTLKNRVLMLTQQPNKNHRKLSVIIALLFITLYILCAYTQPIITQQFDKIRVYKTLAETNQNSGRSLFCKHCVLEQVNQPAVIATKPFFIENPSKYNF